jgi:hypothetical protein
VPRGQALILRAADRSSTVGIAVADKLRIASSFRRSSATEADVTFSQWLAGDPPTVRIGDEGGISMNRSYFKALAGLGRGSPALMTPGFASHGRRSMQGVPPAPRLAGALASPLLPSCDHRQSDSFRGRPFWHRRSIELDLKDISSKLPIGFLAEPRS